MEIPGAVSVVAIQDPRLLDRLSVPLTAARQPLQELGAAGSTTSAARRDVRIIDPPPQLVVRGTTGTPRVQQLSR